MAWVQNVQMYGDEPPISNPSDQAIELRISKRKSQDDAVSKILCDGKPVVCAADAGHLILGE